MHMVYNRKEITLIFIKGFNRNCHSRVSGNLTLNLLPLFNTITIQK